MTEGKSIRRFVGTTDLVFSEALDRIKALLQDEGFWILCEIDIPQHETSESRLSVVFEPYSPEIKTRQDGDDAAAMLLPCDILIQSTGTRSTLVIMDVFPTLGAVPRYHSSMSRLGRLARPLPAFSRAWVPETADDLYLAFG